MPRPFTTIGESPYAITGGAFAPAETPISPANVAASYQLTPSDTLRQMMGAADIQSQRQTESLMERLNNAFARRGLRTSGLHFNAMADLAERLQLANRQANLGFAGQVYGMTQRDAELMNRINMFSEQQADARSAANQQRRGALYGAAGSLLGTALMPGGGGGIGGSGGFMDRGRWQGFEPAVDFTYRGGTRDREGFDRGDPWTGFKFRE